MFLIDTGHKWLTEINFQMKPKWNKSAYYPPRTGSVEISPFVLGLNITFLDSIISVLQLPCNFQNKKK